MTPIELDEKLESPNRFKEIWLQATNGASLCALVNGDVGWLMYLRFEGDAGFSSRNPEVDCSGEIAFVLDNGQEDYYPNNWTYPVEVIRAAMMSFISDGERPSQVEWHDDSQ